MVRAILDGRKTVTRRVMSKGNSGCGSFPYSGLDLSKAINDGKTTHAPKLDDDGSIHRIYPKLRVVDRLWVRETFCRVPTRELLHGGALHGEAPAHKIDGSDPSVAFVYKCSCVGDRKLYWKPSIHMPRAASRITLEVVCVTAERLQDITEEDAIAEGVEGILDSDGIMFYKDYNYAPNHPFNTAYARVSFQRLWESLNAARGYGWDANPWVWRVGFKVLEVKG